MNFRAGATALLSLFALGAGCGRVHDLSVPSQPLLVLHGHVDTAGLTRTAPDAALIGSLTWAAVPTINPVCLPLPPPSDIAAACPDPFGVFDGEISLAAPIDPNGDFDLTILDLPAAAVSVGDQSTRIAYGSLIVIEDIDGDGQPSFPKTGGTTDRGNRRFGGPPQQVTTADNIVAATFQSLKAPQQRVAFREGGFVAPSNFYPACDWSAPAADRSTIPPLGFSFLNVPAYSDPLPASDACSITPIETRVTVPPISPQEGRALLCRPVQQAESTVQEPQTDGQPAGMLTCLSSNVLAAVFTIGLCPSLQSYALVGCGQDLNCTVPEWDDTRSPPVWWSCQ